MKGKLIKVLEHYHLFDGYRAIATTIVENPMLLPNLSLKNCQAIERGYDCEELASEYIVVKPKYREHEHNMRVDSFKAGFQKALEILGDKEFTLENMREAYNDGMANIDSDGDYIDRPDDDFNDTIQSLQQTEWDVEITEDNSMLWQFPEPKLDADGNLILKRK